MTAGPKAKWAPIEFSGRRAWSVLVGSAPIVVWGGWFDQFLVRVWVPGPSKSLEVRKKGCP